MTIARAAGCLVACLAISTGARAVTIVVTPILPGPSLVHIEYSATDLPDVNPGENLYRYDYTLDGYPYAAGSGFSISFPYYQYASMRLDPPDVGVDWQIQLVQPEFLKSGLYGAIALVANPTPLDGFSIEFAWIGDGAPGSQSFLITSPPAGSFSGYLGMGQTTPVPEPTTAGMLALGLLGLALRRG